MNDIQEILLSSTVMWCNVERDLQQNEKTHALVIELLNLTDKETYSHGLWMRNDNLHGLGEWKSVVTAVD